MRKCLTCKRTNEEVPFYQKASRCTTCQKEYMANYRLCSRISALIAYGGKSPKCACQGCDENRLLFLTIDHINGNGRTHRSSLITKNNGDPDKWQGGLGGGAFYRWLKKEGYPKGYQVLCYNCNIARGTGKCPIHEEPMSTDRKQAILKAMKR